MIFSCRKATELASAAMDRDLALRESASLRAHLLICGWCRRFIRQLRLIRRLLRDRLDPHPGPAVFTLSVEARRRIRRALGDPH
jgi:hypothetical protein